MALIQLGQTSSEVRNVPFSQSANRRREASIPAFREINILVHKDDPFVLGSFENLLSAATSAS